MSHRKIACMLALLAVAGTHRASAQSRPTAIQPLQISVFGAATGVYTGLKGGRNFLITAGSDLELPPWHGMRPAVEVRGSYPVDGGNISSERSVLGGLKLEFLINHRLRPYGDFLLGRGQTNYSANNGLIGLLYQGNFYVFTTTYVYSPGFGFDYQFSRHLALRLDGQYQRWASAPTSTGIIYSKVGSVGVVYFFRFDSLRRR